MKQPEKYVLIYIAGVATGVAIVLLLIYSYAGASARPPW